MTETTQRSASPIRLNSQKKDDRVWVELEHGEKELLWTVDQILTACRAFNQNVTLADVDRQVRDLWKVLIDWLDEHANGVHAGYLQLTAPGRLQFLVIQSKAEFDQKLTEALTELDMDIANDDRFRLLKLSVRVVPPAAKDQIEAMLRHGS